MAKAKRFEIKDNKIIAKMSQLTEADIKAIKNYQALFNYELVEYVAPELTDEERAEKKKAAEEKLAKSKYSKKNLEKFIKENGTQEQIKTFNSIQDEIAIDDITNKPKVWEKDTKLHKKGEPKKKGYIAAIQYAKEQFPQYFKDEE